MDAFETGDIVLRPELRNHHLDTGEALEESRREQDRQRVVTGCACPFVDVVEGVRVVHTESA